MKGFKTILGAIAAVAMLSLSFGASAQENANRDENGKIVRGAYETNGFWSNWFIGLGGGINTYWEKGQEGLNIGIAGEGFVGKWFTPCVGARLGYKGVTNRKPIPVPDNTNEKNMWFQHSVNADFLWNISNTIGGYKETRFWEFVPYFTSVFYDHVYDRGEDGKYNNLEFGLGIGLLNDLRLSKHVDLYLQVQCVMGRSAALNNAPEMFLSLLPSATLGLMFNLGKSNWDRHTSITPVVIPVPFTTEQYNALKKRCEELEAENQALKDRIAELEAENAKMKNLKDGHTYIYKDGEFIEVECGEGKGVGPGIIYFDIDKYTLSTREKAHLEYYAGAALDKNSKVTLVGSADKQTGTAAYNQKLTERRAETVKKLLIDKYGLSEDNIEIKAEGASNNLFDTPAKNRCVTITVK